MPYEAEISRTNPTCFLFLIDQSTSMMDPIMGVIGNDRKADLVADALNNVIQHLVVLASKDVDVRRYYQIGVIGDAAACGTEVNNRCGFGRRLGEGVNVGHNVVAKFLFVAGGLFEIDVVEMPGHLVYLGLFYVQAELFLCHGKLKPEPAPGAEFHLCSEKFSHFF